jgi:hypothetical protein
VNKHSRKSFDSVLVTPAPSTLVEAVEIAAAQRLHANRSEYVRQVLLRALADDGVQVKPGNPERTAA